MPSSPSPSTVTPRRSPLGPLRATQPRVVGAVAFLSGIFGAGAAQAQGLDMVAPPGLPPWLAPFAPYLPIVIAAIMGGSTALVGWIVKQIFGVSIEAFCTFAEVWASVVEKRAQKTQSPDDDGPASAFAAALRAVALRLRAAEKTLPVGPKDKGDQE